MDVSSDKDVVEEIEDPERIKLARWEWRLAKNDVLQVMDKVIRFSHQFNAEKLRESIVKVIEALEDVQILRRRQTKIKTFFTKK